MKQWVVYVVSVVWCCVVLRASESESKKKFDFLVATHLNSPDELLLLHLHLLFV